MPDDGPTRVDVVVWRPGGDTIATPDALRSIEADGHDPGVVVATVRERTGVDVAVVRITATHAHVEMLPTSDGASFEWRDPTAAEMEIGGSQPWYRFGWFTWASELIETELKGVGATLVGLPVQQKHWSISALLEVATDIGTFWFKQVPTFMAHEGPLTQRLATIRPDAVPVVVALGLDWALTQAFDSAPVDDSTASPLGVLAELQLAMTTCGDELVELGCPDRRPQQVLLDLVALCDRGDLLDDERRSRLTNRLDRIRAQTDALEETMAASIVHGDLHGGNWTRQRNGSWLIFDWTDGCLGHPFMDLGVWAHLTDKARRAAYFEEYLHAWARAGLDDQELRHTLETALPIAAGFHAVSYQRIVDGLDAGSGEEWKPVVGSFIDRLLSAL